MEELSVITISFEVYKKLLIIQNSMDKRYRYVLGEATITSWQTALKYLLEAKYATKRNKPVYLLQAMAQTELTTLHIRAILELNLANETNLFKVQARIRDAQRQLGGWLRHSRS